MMNTKQRQAGNWQEEQALTRYAAIAPLLDETLDTAKKLKLRDDIAQRLGVSSRTVYRYEAAYRADGFTGLKPIPDFE